MGPWPAVARKRLNRALVALGRSWGKPLVWSRRSGILVFRGRRQGRQPLYVYDFKLFIFEHVNTRYRVISRFRSSAECY